MPSETLPAQNTNAAPAGEPAAPQVTDALLTELNADPSKLKGLETPLRNAVMDRVREVFAQADSPAAAPPEPAKAPEPPPEGEKPAPVADAPQDAPKKGELPQPFDKKAARKRHQELSDEANTWEQKTKAARERAERARKEFEEASKSEVKPPEDPWDKDHQTRLHQEFEQLKGRYAKLEEYVLGKEKDETETIARTAKEKRDDAEFGEVHALQDEYPELKTEKPFKQLNDAYATWYSELVEKSGFRESMPGASAEEINRAAAARYEKDPEFAKQVSPMPIPEKDRDAFSAALTLYHKKASMGGSYKANWLEMLEDKGILKEVVQRGREEAAVESAARTINAIKKQEEAVQPISPEDGSAKGGYLENGMTPQEAAKIQKAIVAKQRSGARLTDQERASFRAANDLLRRAFVGEPA